LNNGKYDIYDLSSNKTFAVFKLKEHSYAF